MPRCRAQAGEVGIEKDEARPFARGPHQSAYAAGCPGGASTQDDEVDAGRGEDEGADLGRAEASTTPCPVSRARRSSSMQTMEPRGGDARPSRCALR
jgi:hypothetical protein